MPKSSIYDLSTIPLDSLFAPITDRFTICQVRECLPLDSLSSPFEEKVITMCNVLVAEEATHSSMYVISNTNCISVRLKYHYVC